TEAYVEAVSDIILSCSRLPWVAVGVGDCPSSAVSHEGLKCVCPGFPCQLELQRWKVSEETGLKEGEPSASAAASLPRTAPPAVATLPLGTGPGCQHWWDHFFLLSFQPSKPGAPSCHCYCLGYLTGSSFPFCSDALSYFRIATSLV
ncbi:unnamed protein product, partial [Rangifer tarandus platyrhynchus]